MIGEDWARRELIEILIPIKISGRALDFKANRKDSMANRWVG
jgi:hypothetical protein